MSDSLHIAVFKADEKVIDPVIEVLQRHDVRISTIAQSNEIIEGMQRGEVYDAIVIPLHLLGGLSGITACLQLRSEEELGLIPIIGLSTSKEKTIIQAFYDVGVSMIQTEPFDPDIIYMHIIALTRQKIALDNYLGRQQESSGFSTSMITAFDSVREGLILFTADYQISFVNASAKILLGLSDTITTEEFTEIENNLSPYIAEHEREMKRSITASGMFSCASFQEVSVARSDGQKFLAAVRIASLSAADGAAMGYSVALTDLSELDQLSNTLTQAQRTRAMCLITAATCSHYMDPSASKIIISPLMRIEELLDSVERSCNLNTTLTTLLEFIDLVASPNVVVKVNVKQDTQLLIRPSDMFQMLGHMILHAIEYAGKSGEVLIDVGDNVPGEGVAILITAKSKKVTPFIPNDYLSDLIQGNLSIEESYQEDEPNKIHYGLSAAQEIADKYRTAIEYNIPSPSVAKLRVKLPSDYKKEEES